MFKITFADKFMAKKYARDLEKAGFTPVATPATVTKTRYCLSGKDVYICAGR